MTESQVRAIAREEFAKLEKERAGKAEAEWAKKAVSFVKENSIMTGDSNGKFRPLSYITRQEAAQVAMNICKTLGKT